MKKLILLAVLAVGAVTLSMTSEAKADHASGCGPGWGGGYYSSHSYAPSYSGLHYGPVYRYSYAPTNSFGYAYPSSGFYYSRPGVSISIGSGYSVGGFGAGRSYYHGHRHHH
jgi:hypothetical protein